MKVILAYIKNKLLRNSTTNSRMYMSSFSCENRKLPIFYTIDKLIKGNTIIYICAHYIKSTMLQQLAWWNRVINEYKPFFLNCVWIDFIPTIFRDRTAHIRLTTSPQRLCNVITPHRQWADVVSRNVSYNKQIPWKRLKVWYKCKSI